MTVAIQLSQNAFLEQFIKSFYNLLPNDFNSFIKSLNCGIFIYCAASDKATAGFGCTSAIIAFAPIAIAAFAVSKRRSRLSVECVTSKTTGKCVSFFKIGTAEISSVLRVALSLLQQLDVLVHNFPLHTVP